MKTRSSVLIIAGIAIAAIISAIIASTYTKLSATEGNGTGQVAENSTMLEKLSFHSLANDGSPVQGNPSAPVTIVEFGDFQCEFCARFAKDTESQIYQSYIQTGKVNMVFKHLVHYGSTSDLAASASQCANDQGKFWDYYHILYTNQDSFMLAQDTEAALKNLASKIGGLDMQKFDSCLVGGTYKDVAKSDTKLADSLGFDNTPSFLIVKSDGSELQKLVGAYPFGTFKAILDKEIDAAGNA